MYTYIEMGYELRMFLANLKEDNVSNLNKWRARRDLNPRYQAFPIKTPKAFADL